jgi:2-oxoglutarate dehydrogenase E1 component
MSNNKLINDELHFGQNVGYIEEIYELFKTSPNLVAYKWREYFAALSNNSHANDAQGGQLKLNGATKHSPIEKASSSISYDLKTQSKVTSLIDAYRSYGHYEAHISPLTSQPTGLPKQPKLDVSSLGFTPEEMESEFYCDNLAGAEKMKLRDIIANLKNIYTANIGFEWVHIVRDEERDWLQRHIEGFTNSKATDKERLKWLEMLSNATMLENELHKRYIGAKRFSLEGGESLIPLIYAMLSRGAEIDLEQVVLGMAHRGRLNVLTNILGRPIDLLLLEFDDRTLASTVGAGDVKYHLGYEASVTYGDKKKAIKINLVPNPSHLEFVNPVVTGIARAYQDLDYIGCNSDLSPTEELIHRRKVLPLLIHGDAAFVGQGVVAETINLSLVEGYRTGGTIHIVINNQIAFTATPDETRSTYYCTDMAKTVDAPVFHVNAEDVDGVCRVGQLAIEYRNRFGKDAIIDLYCYRRYGHNEGDDASYTQPITAREIKDKKPIVQVYHEKLTSEKVVSNTILSDLENNYLHEIERGVNRAKETVIGDFCPLYLSPRARIKETKVSKDSLERVISSYLNYPSDFKVHPKLKALFTKRLESVRQGSGIEWGTAEAIAFGTLLEEGISIRLSGQDSVRGTFSHRHCILDSYDVYDNSFAPLSSLTHESTFKVINSVLSEAAVLGFEFGYSSVADRSLVLWEAQFGDFVNGAQVCIDQFISSGEEKWNMRSGVTLLLPHGYEGAGPEHSSARLERFLQLSADGNMDICVPTTAVQYFHLLRRQVYSSIKRPLVVFTPKSLLRLPEAASDSESFTSKEFAELLRVDIGKNPKRLLFMTGKVFFDLQKAILASNLDISSSGATLVRIEQLHPFPFDKVRSIIDEAGDSVAIAWVQEEPKNQGAWSFVETRFLNRLTDEIRYIGRPVASGTATGSAAYHAIEQKRIVDASIGFITG